MPCAHVVSSLASCLAEGWNGYGVLQSAGGAAGALDVGFVPGTTAGPLSALKLVYLLGADEVPFEELQPGAFVVYQGHHGEAGAQAADLVLPGAAYTEKSGAAAAAEGRFRRALRSMRASPRVLL